MASCPTSGDLPHIRGPLIFQSIPVEDHGSSSSLPWMLPSWTLHHSISWKLYEASLSNLEALSLIFICSTTDFSIFQSLFSIFFQSFANILSWLLSPRRCHCAMFNREGVVGVGWGPRGTALWISPKVLKAHTPNSVWHSLLFFEPLFCLWPSPT